MVAVSVQMWRCTFVVIICCVASALLRFYAAYVGSTLPTSRDNLYVQSARTKQSRNIPAQLLVNKFQHTWRKSEDVLHHDGSLKSRQSFHMFRATEERRGHQTRYYGWQINAKCSLCLKQWIRLGLLSRGAEGVLLFGRVMLWCSLLHLVWIQTVIIHDFWHQLLRIQWLISRLMMQRASTKIWSDSLAQHGMLPPEKKAGNELLPSKVMEFCGFFGLQ